MGSFLSTNRKSKTTDTAEPAASTEHSEHKEVEYVKVRIKTLSGNNACFEIEKDDVDTKTIGDIKFLYELKTGTPREQIRILQKGQNLCPQRKLDSLHIDGDGIVLFGVLCLGSGPSPCSTLMHQICVESMPRNAFHRLLADNVDAKEWHKNLSFIIFEFAPFIASELMVVDTDICLASNGREVRKQSASNFCEFCKHWMHSKPAVDLERMQKLWRAHPATKGYYGVFVRFEFEKYVSSYNEQMTLETDIDAIDQENANSFVTIKESVGGHALKYSLFDKGRKEQGTKQYLTFKLSTDWLQTERVQNAFVDGRLEVDIVVHEKAMPLIINNLTDRGPLLGDTHFKYAIYKTWNIFGVFFLRLTCNSSPWTLSHAFPMDDGRSSLVILLLSDPHFTKSRQRTQYGASDPRRVLSLCRRYDIHSRRGMGQCGHFRLKSGTKSLHHGPASAQHHVAIQILPDRD